MSFCDDGESNPAQLVALMFSTGLTNSWKHIPALIIPTMVDVAKESRPAPITITIEESWQAGFPYTVFRLLGRDWRLVLEDLHKRMKQEDKTDAKSGGGNVNDNSSIDYRTG